jgi:prefoldin subunit 5
VAVKTLFNTSEQIQCQIVRLQSYVEYLVMSLSDIKNELRRTNDKLDDLKTGSNGSTLRRYYDQQ